MAGRLWPAFLAIVLQRAWQAATALDCGARAYVPEGLTLQGTRVDGLQCPGFAEDDGCCEALPVHRVQAFLQYAAKHDREHIAAVQGILAEAEKGLAAAAAQEECGAVFDGMIRPRLMTAKVLAERVLGSIEAVEHLVMSSVCKYCFPEEEGAAYRITDTDGAVATQLSGLAVAMQDAQWQVWMADSEVLAAQGLGDCVPKYFASMSEGSVVGPHVPGVSSIEDHTRKEANAEDSLAIRAGVEAVTRLWRWPQERRRLSATFRAEALEHFDDDFFEAAERILAAVVGPPARMAHQVQLLVLALAGPYHRSSGLPAARLLWGSSATDGNIPADGAAGGVEAEPPQLPQLLRTAAAPPHLEGAAEDAGSAFGLVVLISNRTAEEVLDHLLLRLEGPRALFLEDVCGDALEALGHGCHGGGPLQSRCLTPVHAGFIAISGDDQGRPRSAWRRHGATRTVAHSAWELAQSYWGEGSSVWLADFRPESECPGSLPLAQAAASVPGAKLHVVRDPEVLLGMDLSEPRPPLEGATPADAEGSPVPADAPLASRLSEYTDFHRRGVAELAKDPAADVPVLVYSCQPYAQCGGHGDRLNGIVTAFLLAVLTRRVFLIDAESPLPLQLLLAPRQIDWRVRGGMLATAGWRHHSYHDKRRQFEADLERLAAYPDKVLVLNFNYRLLRMLFEAPVLRPAAAALGLPTHAPPFLVAEVFDILFAPTPTLSAELATLRAALGGPEDGRFIAVHLRTGDVAWDPARHGKAELATFLACARHAEQELGLPPGPETPWLLATDSAEVAVTAADLPEARAGKLRVPGERGRVHIDRSDMADALEGAAANYAEWLLFGRAAAVVLSRSFFGETAAEVGRVAFAYFAPGGGCVRMELSSS